jgi:hypothetical protein
MGLILSFMKMRMTRNLGMSTLCGFAGLRLVQLESEMNIKAIPKKTNRPPDILTKAKKTQIRRISARWEMGIDDYAIASNWVRRQA